MFQFSVLQYAAFTVLLSAFVSAERMLIIEAGPNGKLGPRVHDGMRFCPRTFSKKGFSIICKELAAPVKFQLNGKTVRVERHEPYSLTGDLVSIYILRWKSYPPKATISCIPSKGLAVTATVDFSCVEPTQVPNKRPMTLPIARRTPPPRLPLPAPEVADTHPTAVPIPKPKPPPRSPLPKPRNFIGPTPPPLSPQAQKYRRNKCIVINGNEFVSELSAGWTVEGTAVTYQKDNDYGGVMAGSTSVLVYSFTPPATSAYAVTVDMTSRHHSEHNDIWLRMPDGLNKQHGRSSYYAGDRYIKVFHNRWGRATEAFTPRDTLKWSISTAKKLRRGLPYTISVGGRSTKVTVHRIIMFPCSGFNCVYTSSVWKAGVKACS